LASRSDGEVQAASAKRGSKGGDLPTLGPIPEILMVRAAIRAATLPVARVSCQSIPPRALKR
jgi:hypothetical protein